jgi:5-(carboxyamino)imidazole ribonucleotide synthase
MPRHERVLAIPGAHLHDYGKDPRPGRKLGHATVVARTATKRDARLRRLLRLVPR